MSDGHPWERIPKGRRDFFIAALVKEGELTEEDINFDLARYADEVDYARKHGDPFREMPSEQDLVKRYSGPRQRWSRRQIMKLLTRGWWRTQRWGKEPAAGEKDIAPISRRKAKKLDDPVAIQSRSSPDPVQDGQTPAFDQKRSSPDPVAIQSRSNRPSNLASIQPNCAPETDESDESDDVGPPSPARAGGIDRQQATRNAPDTVPPAAARTAQAPTKRRRRVQPVPPEQLALIFEARATEAAGADDLGEDLRAMLGAAADEYGASSDEDRQRRHDAQLAEDHARAAARDPRLVAEIWRKYRPFFEGYGVKRQRTLAEVLADYGRARAPPIVLRSDRHSTAEELS